MGVIPNQSLRRFRNYITEEEFLHKRYVWWPSPSCDPNTWCRFPGIPGSLSKQDDPDWRLNQLWLTFNLTQITGGVTVYYTSNPNNYWVARAILRARLEYASFRIGPGPLWIGFADPGGHIHKPELMFGEALSYREVVERTNDRTTFK